MATQGILDSISRRVILAAGIGLILILLAATAIVLSVLRQDALERTGKQLGNLATVLGEQTWQFVNTLDLLGRTTADDLRGQFAGKQPQPDGELSRRLEERLAALPGGRMLAFADPRGNAVLHLPASPGTALNVADREHFRVHLERRLPGLYIGTPVVGRATHEWLNVFSYRVEDARGGLRGVVLLAVAMAHVQKLFGAIDLGEGGRVMLFRDDGVLLATHPPEEKAYGRSFAGDALFRETLPAELSGASRRAGILDQQARVIAHVHLNGYPLVVAVSSAENFVLAPWRRDAWRIGAGAAGVIVIVAAVLSFLMLQLRASAGLRHDLDEAGQRLHGIIQSAMDAIITVDERQTVVVFNAAAEKIFGSPAAAAIGGPLERFIPERFRAVHHRHVEHFGETGATTRAMGSSLVLYGLRGNGEEFPIDASISQITVDGRKLYTVILRDVTRRKQAEDALQRSHQELRELSAAMHEVREAERLRIARELHDELAQWLTALKMDVSWFSSHLPREQPQLVDKAEKMKKLVDTTVASVRRIAADLRPVMLDDLGLVAALESLLHEQSQRTGIVVGFEADEDGLNFGEPLSSALYRIAQEALTNVARHAQATEARVGIRIDGDRLVLTVRDNGRGFDPGTVGDGKSYGILGIRERAYTLGGAARIDSRPGGGTLVEVVIPVARYRKGGARE